MSAAVLHDLFAYPKSWRPFTMHSEAVELDFTTRDGDEIIIRGTVDVYAEPCRMFVSCSDPCEPAGLDRAGVASLLRHAVLDGRIGSPVVREAVAREWTVASLEVVK